MGTPGHMKHPFDVQRVGTGQDLINYFIDIKEFLELNPGSLKIDGINVSFKLITIEGGEKEFRMDRGTTHTESVVGMNAEDAYKKWPEGHGMPPAIKTLLDIFNKALPSIKYELQDLEMWDNSTRFFNTEYVAGKTNVQKYNKNFLAIHGINQFYEKKGPKKWVETGKSMDRPGKERPTDPKTGKPVKAASVEVPYNRGALDSLIKKVKPFASQYGFEIYGDVPTEIATEIDFEQTLGSPFTIQMTEEDQETRSLEEWLNSAQNPGRAKITKSDGKQVEAISKDIYMAVLNEIPLMEYLQSPEDVKKAISGAVFNHTTRMLGNDVKSALDSSMGSVADHEGVVLRGMEDFPVKVTGEFIIGGMQTAFREGTARRMMSLQEQTPRRGEETETRRPQHRIETDQQGRISGRHRGTRASHPLDLFGVPLRNNTIITADFFRALKNAENEYRISYTQEHREYSKLMQHLNQTFKSEKSYDSKKHGWGGSDVSKISFPTGFDASRKKWRVVSGGFLIGATGGHNRRGTEMDWTYGNASESLPIPTNLQKLFNKHRISSSGKSDAGHQHHINYYSPTIPNSDKRLGSAISRQYHVKKTGDFDPKDIEQRSASGAAAPQSKRVSSQPIIGPGPAAMVAPRGIFVHGISPIEKFKFDVFYNELVVYFGAKAIEEMLPIHGKDYKFGREHQKAYDTLQKAKGASTTTEPLVNQSGLLITPEIEGVPIPLKEAKELKGIKDVEEELGIETVNMDVPEAKRKIALIPGGFKPPHMGHLALITHYLDEVAPNGKVVIFMGSGGDTPRTIHGNPITFEDALKIWKIYLSNEHIAFPNEILDIKKVEGGPIGHVVDYIKDADPEKEIIYLGAGAKDAKRWKFMLNNPKYNPNNVKIFIEPIPNYKDNEGRPMSATNFRDAIEGGNEELIRSYIPENSQSSYREIIDTLIGQLKEAQQPLGIFLRLIEETINEEIIQVDDPSKATQAVFNPQRTVTIKRQEHARQAVDLPSGAKITAHAVGAEWYRSFDKLKGQFIDFNIRQRSAQILDGANRALTQRQKFDIMSKIEGFIQKTSIKFYPGASGGNKDTDYGGPALYTGRTNQIAVEQFSTYWKPKGTGHKEWVGVVFHELGHAKEEALDRFIQPSLLPRIAKGPVQHIRKYAAKVGVGMAPSQYSEKIYKRIKYCFPGLKQYSFQKSEGEGKAGAGTTEHATRVVEHFASLGKLRQFLGRPVKQIDIKLICTGAEPSDLYRKDFHKPGSIYSKWAATLRPPKLGEGVKKLAPWDVYAELYLNEIWQTFSCKRCGPGGPKYSGVAKIIDTVAQLDTKDIKGPTKRRSDPRLAAPAPHPISENFLNIIEETLDEVMPREMYGGFIDNFPEIAYPKQNDDAEEEATAAEDIIKAMMDALLNIAEEHNIDIEDEEGLEEVSAAGAPAGGGTGDVEGSPGSRKKKSKESEETLIREIEDYLFSMLGVSP